MILFIQRSGFCSVLLLLCCLVVGCGQQKETSRLIDEINADGAKAQTLTKQAELKSAEARKKSNEGDRSAAEKLYEEAANLYGQISGLLNQSADKGEQIVKLDNPDWYKEYFTLYARWTRNLAKFAGGAREELLVRKNGTPSEAQLNSWRENISKLSKENEQLRKEIARIEAEHKTVLINRQ